MFKTTSPRLGWNMVTTKKGMKMVVRLYFEKFGSGFPIVFLHGYPLDHTIWEQLIPPLKLKRELILPDLRGHAKSPVPPAPYSIPAMVEDILTLFDDLAIERGLLVGHSMGGYVALQFARSFPERLAGLILVASHPYPDNEEKRKGRYATIEKVRQEGVKKALADFPQQLTSIPHIQEYVGKIIRATNAEGVIGSLQAMAEREDCSDVLAHITMPTAVILGKNDLFIPQEQREQMIKQFRYIPFFVVEDAAHMIMMEEPFTVEKIIMNVISKIEEKK